MAFGERESPDLRNENENSIRIQMKNFDGLRKDIILAKKIVKFKLKQIGGKNGKQSQY